MKHAVLLISYLFITLLTTLQAQDAIPNHSFEAWDGPPVDWLNPVAYLNNVVPSTDAQEGQYAALLKAVWDDNSGKYVPAQLSTVGFAVTGTPAALHGFFKGTSIGQDRFAVTVLLSDAGGLTSGTGIFSITESVDEWTSFTAPITYTGEAPAFGYISVIISGTIAPIHNGTEFLVDNLSWEGESSVNDLQLLSNLNLAPNPAHQKLQVTFTLARPDRFTFEIMDLKGKLQVHLADQPCTAGENSLGAEYRKPPARYLYTESEKLQQ